MENNLGTVLSDALSWASHNLQSRFWVAENVITSQGSTREKFICKLAYNSTWQVPTSFQADWGAQFLSDFSKRLSLISNMIACFTEDNKNSLNKATLLSPHHGPAVCAISRNLNLRGGNHWHLEVCLKAYASKKYFSPYKVDLKHWFSMDSGLFHNTWNHESLTNIDFSIQITLANVTKAPHTSSLLGKKVIYC